MSITQDTYLERSKRLGLDPKLYAAGTVPVVMALHGIEHMRQLLNFSNSAEAPLSQLTALDIPNAPDIKVRAAIVGYLSGQLRLNQETQEAIDERFPCIPLHVFQGQNIDVTADKPLIISSTSAVTNFGVVTIKDGGYIDISIDCQFVCDELVKIPGGSSKAAADIVVHGKNGTDGISPATAQQAGKGDDGPGAACDCCGGIVAHYAGIGGDGAPGLDGVGASGGGNAAKYGPRVSILINKLCSPISIIQQGGNGGKGGDGANGQQGGNGGKGGDGTTCGAYQPDGAKGGAGGNGGGGGASASGGNGGAGGNLTVQYVAASGELILGNNYGGIGGVKGQPGNGGSGGMGGAGGARGGVQGNNGGKGGVGADNGNDGSDGDRGTFTINGEPVN